MSLVVGGQGPFIAFHRDSKVLLPSCPAPLSQAAPSAHHLQARRTSGQELVDSSFWTGRAEKNHQATLASGLKGRWNYHLCFCFIF